MSKAGPLKLATLRGAVGESVSLGWKPRDVRYRVLKRAKTPPDNWIKVRGDVRCPEGAWTFEDQAFTEREACELVDLLSMRPWTGGRALTFLEPCLSFSTRGTTDLGERGELLHVDIRFRAEAAPPFALDVWHEGFTLGLHVTDDELRRFANDLRGMLGLST